MDPIENEALLRVVCNCADVPAAHQPCCRDSAARRGVRAKHRAGKTGKGNPYLKGLLGEVAAAAAKTDTFLGERYRRIVKRRGKLKALVAIARSILTIVWHLLADPTQRFADLGADYHTIRIDKGRKIRNLVRQLEALGQSVTLQPAAWQSKIISPRPWSG